MENKHHNHTNEDHKHSHEHHDHSNHNNGHESHDHHQGHHAHMIEDFKKRFWISLVITLPIVVLAPMIQGLIGYELRFNGDRYVQFVLSSIIFFYGGWPFLKGLADEVKKKAIQRTKEVNTGRKLTPEHIAKTRRTGQKQPESQKIKVAEALSKEYIIEAPNGTKYNIKNLRKFAISKQLDQGNLTKVAQGKWMSHKG